MKRYIFILLYMLVDVFIANADAIKDQKSLHYLYELAGKNLNSSSSISESKILNLCRQLEAQARSQKDFESLFIIQQIAVNSYCIKGDIGLAVNKAQRMYDEAKAENFNIGIALSLQAIGDTYMHSNQNQQALSTFKEASDIMGKSENIFVKIRLLMQQMHVCTLLKDTKALDCYLVEARKLLDYTEFANKQDYIFYLQAYHTFYNIIIKDIVLARNSLEGVRQMKLSKPVFNYWYYFLSSLYYDLINDHERALIYCDSTKNVVIKGGNLNEYRNLMFIQAHFLTQSGEKEQACDIYDSVYSLSKKLNMIRYSQQIDSLHVSYWVDQMELENAAIHNVFLRWLISGAFLFLLFASLLFYIARKKNKKLIESRKELEKARQETVASIQSKSMFLSNMSHELRTPLNAIVGFADLLSMEAVDDAETKQQFGDRIKQNADLLVKLFNDVADLSALKGKNIKFTFGTCDAVAICRNVVDTVNNVKRTLATLHFDTLLNELPIYTDSGRLQQVLINLLINATKFTDEGTITLILKQDEEHQKAIFIVEDTGCGIPLEKQPHIFERFEKLHDSIQGAGLGLSICQLIVEYVGGTIWIDSEYIQGARFIFTHPLNAINKTSEL